MCLQILKETLWNPLIFLTDIFPWKGNKAPKFLLSIPKATGLGTDRSISAVTYITFT